VADKYVKGSTSDANFKDFVDFTDLDSLLDNLKPDSTISKVAGKPVGGVATVGLLDSDTRTAGRSTSRTSGRRTRSSSSR